MNDRAARAKARAIAPIRDAVARRLADAVRNDDDLARQAVEVGLVDRNWLDDPGANPITTAGPVEMLQRYLESTVEQRPSLMARLGLSAIELLDGLRDDAPAGTSVRMAVVFTDIESFTTFTRRAGDAAAADLLAEHQRRVGPIVRSRGGTQVKRIGDGMLLTFPQTEAAVLAAIELLGSVPDPLRLRAGVHVGEVMQVANDVVGHTVNVAARVTESTRGGQVSVTREVRDETGELPGVSFGRLRRKHFKGLDETVQVCTARVAD